MTYLFIYLFIYLFVIYLTTPSLVHVTQRRMVDGTVKNKLERMWDYTVVAEFELGLQIWHEENHEENHNDVSSAWDTDPGPREQKAGCPLHLKENKNRERGTVNKGPIPRDLIYVWWW